MGARCSGRRRFLKGSLALAGLGLGLSTGCGGLPFGAREPKKVPRIGVLTTTGGTLWAFQTGMLELGYVQGRDFVPEIRYAGTNLDRLPELAAELVSLPVDIIVIVGGAGVAAHAAKAATSSIPIVMGHSGNDPVAEGLVASLAHPGGNVTGLSSISDRLTQKRLELLRDAVPGLARVGVLWEGGSLPMRLQLAQVQAAAPALGLQIVPLEIRPPGNIAPAFATAAAADVRALMVLWNTLISADRAQIVYFATQARWPSISEFRYWADDGGLLAYGPNQPEMYRRAATYVDKILKGAKPADLPVEQPTNFDFIINLKTARALGLTIPQSVLMQATELIQ